MNDRRKNSPANTFVELLIEAFIPPEVGSASIQIFISPFFNASAIGLHMQDSVNKDFSVLFFKFSDLGMMKLYPILSIALYFFCTPLLGQAELSPRLLEKMGRTAATEMIEARICLPDTLNWSLISVQWDAKGIPAEERVRRVNRLLISQARFYQDPVLEFLEAREAASVGYVQNFYLTNSIVLKALPHVLHACTTLPQVERIDLAEGELEPMEFFPAAAGKTSAVQGTENGLKAIHAPQMWQLGYTGKSSTLFVFDSGVWSQHPAFSDRFLGRHRPMDQAWKGLFTRHPSGVNSNHGTHVCGTATGLDPRTADTIGVAFGSYWMANDLINASTAAGLPDLVHLIGSFQWALDPDGDTATSSDVPHVINNSWRWRDQLDTVQCGGFIVQLMNAIEAAGIANVFSGGNTGPSNSMLNSPQRIKSNPVNVFSVGSVNGNVAFPHPISGFSTRGPSQCPSSGTLNIHPEVVAPGENVRSAWGMDGYNSISGTSMSSPHVSGAVLLLKEAFPQLTGAQLLTALYTTATDMGVAGEDNVYGNGLIDVHAAFLWLAQQHTPRDPLSIDFDLAIIDFYSPGVGDMGCDTSLTLEIVVENRGQQPINQIDVQVLNAMGSPSVPLTYGVQLPNFGSVDTVRLNGTYSIQRNGAQEIQVIAEIDSVDYDLINNARVFWYHALPLYELNDWNRPVLTEFDLGIRSDLWHVDNPDLAVGWDTIDSRFSNESWARVQMSNYDPANDQKDQLISPVIKYNSPGGGAPTLEVNYAYRPLGPVPFLHDTFRIKASLDCGMSFSHLIYEAWGDSLMTTTNYGSNFIPTSFSDFKTLQFLSELPAGSDEMVFSFETTNRKGNNFFLRNITIEQRWISAESFAQDFRLFPNPSSGRFELHAEGQEGRAFSWSLLDMQGRNLRSGSFVGGRCVFDLGDLSDGVYQLTLSNSDRTETHRLVKASD